MSLLQVVQGVYSILQTHQVSSKSLGNFEETTVLTSSSSTIIFPSRTKSSFRNRQTSNVCIIRGLGAVIAEKFAAEGSNVGINYASNAEAANTLAERLKKEYGVKTAVFQGDAGVLADCKYLVHETIKTFGGIDVIIGNAVGIPLYPSRVHVI
jgi:hypothetical protein